MLRNENIFHTITFLASSCSSGICDLIEKELRKSTPVTLKYLNEIKYIKLVSYTRFKNIWEKSELTGKVQWSISSDFPTAITMLRLEV